MACARDEVQREHAEVAAGAHRCPRVHEQPGEAIGEQCRAGLITAAALAVGSEHGLTAEVLSGALGLGEQVGQLGDVTQAEVEALPGDRVQRMRCVADQHQARAGQLLREHQPQRIGDTPAGAGQSAHALAEALL